MLSTGGHRLYKAKVYMAARPSKSRVYKAKFRDWLYKAKCVTLGRWGDW